MTISHILFLIGIPMLVISLGYIFITQWRLVNHMAKKADLLEAGKITLDDLSDEEMLFILTHYKINFQK